MLTWVLITPRKPQPSEFFWNPGTENLHKSPRQTKSPDNSNILHMFNNNTDTDLRTAGKHPSYVIEVIWQNQNVTKLNNNCLAKTDQDWHL